MSTRQFWSASNLVHPFPGQTREGPDVFSVAWQLLVQSFVDAKTPESPLAVLFATAREIPSVSVKMVGILQFRQDRPPRIAAG